jgi:hypothetical protein
MKCEGLLYESGYSEIQALPAELGMTCWAITPDGTARVWASLLPLDELSAFFVRFCAALNAAGEADWPFNTTLVLYGNRALILLDALEAETRFELR